MNDEQRITDDGDMRKYRTEIPNMADDELDPFQFRLYSHYKRVCGGKSGTCWETVRTTSEKTKMCTNKVLEVRQWLADNGWIALEQQPNGRYHITIIDRWAENFARYAPTSNVQPVSYSEQPVSYSEQDLSHIQNQRSNSFKKELEKKGDSASVPARQPQQPLPSAPVQETYFGLPNPRHRQSRSVVAENMVEACELGLSMPAFTALSEAVADGCGKLPLYRAGRDQAIQEAQRTALTLLRLDARFRTLEGVASVFKSWEANDFRGHTVPTFNQLEEHASLMVSGKVVCNRKDAPAAPTPPPQPAVYQMPAAALAMKQRAEAAARGVTY